MRLFVGLEIPAALRAELERRLGEMRPRLPAARWVPVANLHLTLLFLGERARGDLAPLAAALEAACSPQAPFRVRVYGSGTFPPRRPARVAWLGLEGEEAVARLQAEVASRVVAALGLEPETRPYHAHLTVARCRSPWPRAAEEAWRAAFPGPVGEPFEVRRAVLFESILAPRGASYEIVETFALGGGAE